MPDKLPFIDGLMAAICVLQKEDALENRRLLAGIDSCVVLEFMEDMKNKNLAEVRNYSAWLKKVFMEFLRRRDAEFASLDL